jgi:hypothetical protein
VLALYRQTLNCATSPSQQATIAGGGVIPHIHKSLIGKTGKELGAK